MAESETSQEGAGIPAPPVIEEKLRNLLVEVNSLSNRLRQLYAHTSLPSGEQHVLEILVHAGPQTVPQLARLRSTSRQNIQILINRLEREGCVSLRPNPAHKRSSLVTLTGRGEELQTVASAERTNVVATLTPHVSQAALTSAVELLGGIRRILSNGENEAARPAKAREGARGSRRKAPRVRAKAKPTPSTAPENYFEPADLPLSLL
jgi:DNA-binding MarR family transcriptional regulator